MLRTNLVFILLAVSSLFIVSCNNNDTSTFDYVGQAIKDDTLLAKYMRDSNFVAKRHTKGYYVRITDSMSGNLRAEIGKTVFLRYRGLLLNDTVFDSNLNNSRALVFEVGSGVVIAGLDSAIQFFHKGEKGRIYLPSRLGYGNVTQSKIPANSCLIFEVNALNVE